MNDNIIKNINRDANFTLSQKRVLKSAYNTNKKAVENVAASVPDPVSVYGGTLVYGGVTWLQDLVFDVSATQFIIDGVTYNTPPTVLTLDAADATNPRIDVIYVGTDGAAGFITGTPAADPAKPEVDETSQLELTFITVAANATDPSNAAVTLLYGEDAGDPTEWDATESTSAARIDLDNTESPYAGTKAIKFTEAVSSDFVTLTAGSTGVTVGDIDALELHLQPVTMDTRRQLRVAFFNGNSRVSGWVQVKDGNFGFDSTNPAYQTVNIAASAFSFSDAVADSVRFQIRGRGGAVTAYLDQVRLQTGGGTTIVNITQGLTESQLVNNVRTWNVQQPFDNGTLTDGATITWDLDTDPIATITLGGDRTLNFTNARAGGTYILKVVQDPTGTRLITWDADIEWPGGAAPTLTTTGGAYDVFTFIAFDDTTLSGVTGGLAFS